MCVTNNSTANTVLAVAAVAAVTYFTMGAGTPAAAGAVSGSAAGGAGAGAAGAGAAGAGGAAAGSSWVPYAMMGASMAGAGMNAAGQASAARAAREAGKYNSSLAEYNAQVNMMRGEQAKTKGELEKREVRERLSLLEGVGTSRFAGGNIQLGSGSPETWMEDTYRAAAEDENMVDYNTGLAVWGFGEQAKGNMADAGLARMEGEAGYSSGMYGAGGSLLQGTGNVATQWYAYKKSGLS